MSAPTFVAAGATNQATGGASFVWPAGHQADDIGILYLQTANEAVATPSGWTACPDSPQGVGTAATAGSTRVTAFWKRATSAAEADAVVADAGDHLKGRILVFRGCETSGSPFNTSAGGTLGSADTACQIPGVTTTVDECYVVFAVANGTDISGNQTTSSGFANSNISGLTRIMTSNTTTGLGGGVDAAGGVKTTAGATGGTTVTLANATLQGLLTLALKPPAVPGGGSATEGGISVITGVKATAGVVSATTGTYDTASAQARITIALKPPAAPPVDLPPVIAFISDKALAAGVTLEFPIIVSDPEGETPTVNLVAGTTSVPTGATIQTDPDDGSLFFSWTPTAAQAGEWNVAVEASDGTNTVSQAFTLTVAAEPPVDLLALATAIAARAETDIEAARALADAVELNEQMNAKVLHDVRTLISDLEASRTYMTDIITQLEEETDPV